MSADALEQALLSFVNDELLRGNTNVTATDRLFEEGYLDSLKVLELVAFLESATGRRVPDRMVRLANFRSVRAIARAFQSDAEHRSEAEVSPRYAYHTNPVRFASPVAALRRGGELVETGFGSVRLSGRALELFQFFDRTFARWGREVGAPAISDAVPDTIDVGTLERAGFLESFPHLLVAEPAGDVGVVAGTVSTPAACYHRYHELADSMIPGATIVGVKAICRRAERDCAALERMTEFTMREVVTLGARPDVERVRQRLIRRIDRFVSALALDGAIEVATDPFFAGAATAQALAQRAGDLKLELRLSLDTQHRIAVASFNRHHDYFGRRFGISLPDGSPAHSGCVAFGIERWVLAFLTQHGVDERSWPSLVRDGLEIQRAHVAAS